MQYDPSGYLSWINTIKSVTLYKFKMAFKSKEVQRQYPNLLERFLDFGGFEGRYGRKNHQILWICEV